MITDELAMCDANLLYIQCNFSQNNTLYSTTVGYLYIKPKIVVMKTGHKKVAKLDI